MSNTTYERPHAPDMLPNGKPNITVLRTSRARQVNQNIEYVTEPVVNRRKLPFNWWGVGICTFLFLCLFICWMTIVVPWWGSVQDQWNYGASRITQMDANVGHGGEEHFIAEYYKGAIIVIEIPFANPNASKTYTIVGLGTNNATPVVQLGTIKDIQTGRTDLVVQVEGTNFSQVLYNTGSAFTQEVP